MQTNAIDLSGRVAVVTGGAQGIGLTVGRRLIASGAKLAVWDVSQENMEKARSELGAVHMETVDIASYPSVEAALAGTLAALGRVDILINNAAIVGPNATLADYPR